MDRTTRGLVAGIIAGIAMNAWNLFDYYLLHITELRFLDWLSVLLTWKKPENSFQTVIALILQTVVWDGFLGIIFAHITVLTTSRLVVCKSVLYSVLLWFIFKTIVNLYRVPFLSADLPYNGRLSNLLAAIIWGIVMGLVLKALDKRGC